LKLSRQIKYYYLRFIRLRGEPHELALGLGLGVFCGMLPILPFQTALAVTLALLFRGSKITAALGTWISNPLNWYFIYYYSYKIGGFLLGLPEKNAVVTSIMEAVRSGEEFLTIVAKILGAGGCMAAAFLLGGFLMGLVVAPPFYFIFLHFFRRLRTWRQLRKARRNGLLEEP